jgi:hypothetical protein
LFLAILRFVNVADWAGSRVGWGPIREDAGVPRAVWAASLPLPLGRRAHYACGADPPDGPGSKDSWR